MGSGTIPGLGFLGGASARGRTFYPQENLSRVYP